MPTITQWLAMAESALPPEQYAQVVAGLGQIVNRILEARVLTAEEFSDVRRAPGIFGVREVEDRIRAYVDANGLAEAFPAGEIASLRVQLHEGYATAAQTAPVAWASEREVLRVYQQEKGTELRCENCGFHFTTADLSPSQRQTVSDLELELATALHPARRSDPTKSNSPRSTRLEVDHVIPRHGWGVTRSSNLQVLCGLCNQGKSYFRRDLESLSVAAAAGFSRKNMLVSAIVYSALAVGGRVCHRCGYGVADRELTLVFSDEETWRVPWTARPVCYECQAGEAA